MLCEKRMQMLPNLPITVRRVCKNPAERGEQILVQHGPITVHRESPGRRSAPQVRNLTVDHHQQPMGGEQQAELEEHLDLKGPSPHAASAEDPEMWRASCPLRTSLNAAQYTPAKRNQQAIESESRIATDLCNYWQKLPYVIARKMR
jgi:hypothetical protein